MLKLVIILEFVAEICTCLLVVSLVFGLIYVNLFAACGSAVYALSKMCSRTNNTSNMQNALFVLRLFVFVLFQTNYRTMATLDLHRLAVSIKSKKRQSTSDFDFTLCLLLLILYLVWRFYILCKCFVLNMQIDYLYSLLTAFGLGFVSVLLCLVLFLWRLLHYLWCFERNERRFCCCCCF